MPGRTHETATDLSDAYEFISYVRLEHQAKAVLDGRSPGNHVNPDTLSSLDRRHLRDAFGVVRTVQGQVAQRYPAARI